MIILGISAYFHDSAACILKNGEILSAVQEERFTRIKHDASFPKNAINYCFNSTGIAIKDVDVVVFYEKPLLKFERIFETYLAIAPKGFVQFSKSLPLWAKERLFLRQTLLNELRDIGYIPDNHKASLKFSEHHFSHAASAFYPSPFESAAVLTIDGVGEWATASISFGVESELQILKEINFPHSLGLLYSAFTGFCGFKVNSGEYKLMGLAPYGNPIYVDTIKDHLISISDDGSFTLNIDYFDFLGGLKMTNRRFNELFGGKPREPESPLGQREMDLASSIQKVTEEVVLKMAQHARKITGSANLCLAGGVALNCVSNGLLKRANVFENIWVQPAAGDAGGALGAALAIHYVCFQQPRSVDQFKDQMNGSLLGPAFESDEIRDALDEEGAKYELVDDDQLFERVAKFLADGLAVGWMQGRAEFGPRALGNRSIIADPRSPKMQKQLNLKIKQRESFRPFAPSVLIEEVSSWFDFEGESPYMLMVAQVHSERLIDEHSNVKESLIGLQSVQNARSEIPAVTHVDNSARVQTVDKSRNPKFYALISCFFKKTGCPVLVNTSFNVRGEPIVCTPKDAFRCFMGTELDVLVIENFILLKTDQMQAGLTPTDYVAEYELD